MSKDTINPPNGTNPRIASKSYQWMKKLTTKENSPRSKDITKKKGSFTMIIWWLVFQKKLSSKLLIMKPISLIPKMEEKQESIKLITSCTKSTKGKTSLPILFQQITRCITKLSIKENIRN